MDHLAMHYTPEASHTLGKRTLSQSMDNDMDDRPMKKSWLAVPRTSKLICTVECNSGAQSDEAVITAGALDKAIDSENNKNIPLLNIDYDEFICSLADYPALKDVDFKEMYSYDNGNKKFKVSSQQSFQRALKIMHHDSLQTFRFFVPRTGEGEIRTATSDGETGRVVYHLVSSDDHFLDYGTHSTTSELRSEDTDDDTNDDTNDETFCSAGTGSEMSIEPVDTGPQSISVDRSKADDSHADNTGDNAVVEARSDAGNTAVSGLERKNATAPDSDDAMTTDEAEPTSPIGDNGNGPYVTELTIDRSKSLAEIDSALDSDIEIVQVIPRKPRSSTTTPHVRASNTSRSRSGRRASDDGTYEKDDGEINGDTGGNVSPGNRKSNVESQEPADWMYETSDDDSANNVELTSDEIMLRKRLVSDKISSASFDRMNSTSFNDYLRYFGLQDVEAVDPTKQLSFKGLGGTVYSYQAFGALQMLLQQASEIGGGFLGDDERLGMTRQYVFAAILFQALVHRSKDVKKSQRARDGRHNGPDVATQCPSAGDDYPWQCPCEYRGVAWSIQQQRNGFTLFIVQHEQIPTVMGECSRFMGTTDSIYISPSNQFRPRVAICLESVDSRRNDDGTKILAPNDAADVLRTWHPRNLHKIKIAGDAWWEVNKDEPFPEGPSLPDPRLPPNAGDIFIVTTPQSLKSQVLDVLADGDPGYNRAPERYPQVEKRSALNVGLIDQRVFQLIVVDDWYVSKAQDTKLHEFLSSHVDAQNWPHIWGVSSTPIPTGLSDLMAWWPVFERPAWRKNTVLKAMTKKRIRELSNALEDYIRISATEATETPKDLLDKFIKVAQELVIRRTDQSQWPDMKTAHRLTVQQKLLL